MYIASLNDIIYQISESVFAMNPDYNAVKIPFCCRNLKFLNTVFSNILSWTSVYLHTLILSLPWLFIVEHTKKNEGRTNCKISVNVLIIFDADPFKVLQSFLWPSCTWSDAVQHLTWSHGFSAFSVEPKVLSSFFSYLINWLYCCLALFYFLFLDFFFFNSWSFFQNIPTHKNCLYCFSSVFLMIK